MEKISRCLVESVRLDDYFKKNLEKIKFFKMDIQGAEPLALEEMRKLLTSRKLKFTTEFFPKNIELINRDAKNMLDFIKLRDFLVFDLDGGNKKVTDNLSFGEHHKKNNYFTTLYCKNGCD